jgi:hypothetical protein
MRRALTILITGLLALVPNIGSARSAQAAAVVITNATQFTDTTGAIVHAHGGGVIKVGTYYYWFGENRNADNTFRYVSAYRSSDLKTWEFRRNVLTQSSAAELATAYIERPKVVYNASTGQFVMWMHKENGVNYNEARAAVAVSSTIDGAYTYRGSFQPLGNMSRDSTLFVDDDGTGYFVSAANNNADLHFYRLNADYLSVATLIANPWPGASREAPALFKRDGVYFLLSSTTSGWNPNQQKYSTATSLAGPWSAQAEAGNSTTYGSQTAYVLTVQGTSATSYLYLGDRWGNSIGGTVNDSQYIWLPLRFPTARTLVLPWYPQVSIDTATGVVNGAGGGPYYNLVARHSSKCADVNTGAAANGLAVVQWTCTSGLNQQWRFEDAGSGYNRIIAEHSGRCLDVSSASTVDGANVLQYDCGSGTNQQWQIQDAGSGYVRLVARHSGKCLDVVSAGTADGARFVQYACGSGTNQQFLRRAVS